MSILFPIHGRHHGDSSQLRVRPDFLSLPTFKALLPLTSADRSDVFELADRGHCQQATTQRAHSLETETMETAVCPLLNYKRNDLSFCTEFLMNLFF